MKCKNCTVRNCKFSIIFEFLFTLDKYKNYNISMYFKNTTKKNCKKYNEKIVKNTTKKL